MSAWMVCDKQISAVLHTAIEMGIIPQKDAKRIGQTIVNANVKSLFVRYGDNSNKHRFCFKRVPKISKKQAHKYAHCIAYQCCEYNTWKKSKGNKFLMLLCAKIEENYGLTYKEVTEKLWEGLHWSYR